MQINVRVADEELNTVQATVFQRSQEVAPVHFLLRKRDRAAQHLLLTVQPHAGRRQHGDVDDQATVAHLFVARVQVDVGIGAQRPAA